MSELAKLIEKLARLRREYAAAQSDHYSAPNYRQSEMQRIQDEIDGVRVKIAELEGEE